MTDFTLYEYNCVLVDLDNTLCDSQWRSDYARTKQWDKFHERCVDDKPWRPVHLLLKSLPRTLRIIAITGRPEKYRNVTVGWLMGHGVPVDRLYMRADDDFRPDVEVKREFLENIRSREITPILALEDRPRVVAMFREEGVPCFQVRSDEESY